MARYGLTPRPDAPSLPLQYVVDERGRWVISCFACHGGQVGEQVLPGLPNAHLALQDLSDDMAALRASQRRLPTMGESVWRTMPLGETHGTTNAVMFSVALLALRDQDLNLVPPTRPLAFVHHDLDAPPWWHVAKRKTLYCDGFTPCSHRPLMQFLLVPSNPRKRFDEWEPEFRDILAYLKSLEPPRWPYGGLDAELAAQGRKVFERTCARCHGTYGEAPTYPERVVPIEDVGTDRVRLNAISAEEREIYAHSWFTGKDPKGVTIKPAGYVAPPLDGIWASAPYLHNGSVPTLWHLLHPESRPKVWRRAGPPAYDRERVGLEVKGEAASIPADAVGWDRHAWFDTSAKGKSAAGHLYPSVLSEPERRALLEYLKTL
jgi:cytochrome c553